MPDPFATALRAELDAVVARYEALVRALAESDRALQKLEADRVRSELGASNADRDRLVVTLREAEQRAVAARVDVEALRAQLEAARTLAAREQRRADDAEQRVASMLADTRRKQAELDGELDAAKRASDALAQAFAQERAFIAACNELAGTALLEAVRATLGIEPTADSTAYAALKAKRPDAVLTQVVKERGRQVTSAGLNERERAALAAMAQAVGCELIVPAGGTRFSTATMEKTATRKDPAEEGNVVECAMPGLRLAGTEGALVFPKVIVATG